MFKRRKPEDAASPAPLPTLVPPGLDDITGVDEALLDGGMQAAPSAPPSAAPSSTSVPPRRPDAGFGVPPYRPVDKEAPSMGRSPFPAPPTPPSGQPAPGMGGPGMGAPGAMPAPRPGALPGAMPGGAPGGRPREPAERRTLVVGRGISVQGVVTDAERLVVEGTVEATMIHATELAIAQGGVFKGEVEVEDAEIAGVIDGTLTARGNLVVRATGKVLGTARCRRLQVEDGGQITGRIEMITEARTDTPRPPAPETPPAA